MFAISYAVDRWVLPSIYEKSYTTVPLFGFSAWCLELFLSVQIYLSVNFIIREFIFINIMFVKELFWLLYVIVINLGEKW